MAQLNVAQARIRLDKNGILVIDRRHAKFFLVSKAKIIEKDYMTSKGEWVKKVGTFLRETLKAISNKETRIEENLENKFFKMVLSEIEKSFSNDIEKLILMCPEEESSQIAKNLPTNLKRKPLKVITGNYIKTGTNQILEKVLEAI